MANELPEGFTLDAPSISPNALPAGFKLDQSGKTEEPGITKTFLKRLALAQPEVAAGLVGMGFGAEAGLAAGPFAPIASPIGAIIGGGLAAYGASKAQEKVMEAMPETSKTLGIDPETLAAEAKANPYTTKTADILSQIEGFKVSNPLKLLRSVEGLSKVEAENLIKERASAAANVALGGITSVAQQKLTGQPIDWTSTAESAAMGAFLHEPRKAGAALMGVGERFVPGRAGRLAARATAAEISSAEAAAKEAAAEEVVPPPTIPTEAPEPGSAHSAADVIAAGTIPRRNVDAQGVPTDFASRLNPTLAQRELAPFIDSSEHTPEHASNEQEEQWQSHRGLIGTLDHGDVIRTSGNPDDNLVVQKTVPHVDEDGTPQGVTIRLAKANDPTQITHSLVENGVDGPQLGEVADAFTNTNDIPWRTENPRVESGRPSESDVVPVSPDITSGRNVNEPLNEGVDSDLGDVAQVAAGETTQPSALTPNKIKAKDPLFDRSLTKPVKPLPAKPTVPDSRVDNALEFLTKTKITSRRGKDQTPTIKQGLNVDEAEAEGIDTKDIKLRGISAKPYNKNGMSFDDAAEVLAEAGYLPSDELLKTDTNAVVDAHLSHDNLRTLYSENADPARRYYDEDMARWKLQQDRIAAAKKNIDQARIIFDNHEAGHIDDRTASALYNNLLNLGDISGQLKNLPTQSAEIPVVKPQVGVEAAGMKANDVQSTVDEHTAGWTNKPDISVVQSHSDLPDTIRDQVPTNARGAYDPATGTVHVIADNADNVAGVKGTVFHESLGHYGLDQQFGNKLDTTLNDIYKNNTATRKEADQWMKDNPDVYAHLAPSEQATRATEEVLAHRSEAGPIQHVGIRAAFNKVAATVRDFARSMGLVTKYSDNDIAQILRQAHEKVRTGVATKGAAAEGVRLQTAKQAGPAPKDTMDDVVQRQQDQFKQDKTIPKVFDMLKNFANGHETYEKMVTHVNNYMRPLKNLQEYLRSTGQLITGGFKATDLYDTIQRAMGRGSHLYQMEIAAPVHKLNRLISKMAKAKGIDIDKMRATISTYLIGLHEPTRRWEFYRRNVPMQARKKIDFKGVVDTPANIREALYKEMSDKSTTVERNKILEQDLNDLVNDERNLDAYGSSPIREEGTNSPLPIGKEKGLYSDLYSPTGGYSRELIAEINSRYQEDLAKHPELHEAISTIRDIISRTRELNREANYWTSYQDKIVAFYGKEFQDTYVPLIGRKGYENDQLNLGGRRVSGDLASAAQSMEGGTAEASDVVLQVMAEAARAASRAGRGGDASVTQVIKNLITNTKPWVNKKGINGQKIAHIDAQDRYFDRNTDTNKLQDPNNFFHHLPNGDIEVYRIHDPRMAEAIRKPYQETSQALKIANLITGGIAQGFTRYRIPFAPMMFIKHSFSNSFNMATKNGVLKSIDYLGQVLKQTANGQLKTNAELALAIHRGDKAKVEQIRNSSIDGRNAVEYIETGARTAMRQATSAIDQLTNMHEQLGTGKILRTKQQLDKYFDTWSDMFDITSRAAAYGVIKRNLIAKGMTESQARLRAAAETKELTNYNLMGKSTQKAASIFMFFRPVASSAVAAMDAMRPAFQSWKWKLSQMREVDRQNPELVAAYKADHMQQQKNARYLLTALAGAGALIYNMSYQTNPDAVGKDDMERWNRFIRLPIPGSDKFFQIPWGFGLGGIGAMGAHIAAIASGHQTVKEGITNIAHTAIDSFMPMPFSQISPKDHPLDFIVDTMTPTAAKPLVEYMLDMNSMGSQIYNSHPGKYSDVYTGGENIPQGYKDAAQYLYHITGGKVEISPNTLNFFATSYIQAVSDFANMGYGVKQAIDGTKNIDPKVFAGTFIGNTANKDAKEFGEIKDQMESVTRRYNSAMLNPTEFAQYLRDNPQTPGAVAAFKQNESHIKTINSRIQSIRVNQYMSPQQREDQIKLLTNYKNIMQRNAVNNMKWMGVTP